MASVPGSTTTGSGLSATVTVSPAAAGSVAIPTRPSRSRCSSTGRSVPSSRLTRAGRKVTRDGPGSTGAVSTRPAATVPPAHTATSSAVRSAPIRASRASWPFSKRLLASERRARRCAVRRMLTGSNTADSMTTSVVAAVTSDAAPPMTPAIPIGPSASAMSSISGVRSRSTWSSVSRRSPAIARRTTIVARPSGPGWTAAASKVWIGLPISSIT